MLKFKIMPALYAFSAENMVGERDVGPLAAALRRRPMGPSTMANLADTIFDVTSTLPAAQINPIFGEIYGSLTANIGKGIAHPGRYMDLGLPRFNQPDELTGQAFNFEETWAEALEDVVMFCTGTDADREVALQHMGPLWAMGLLNKKLQLVPLAVYFLGGGMVPHIMSPIDLMGSLMKSEVSEAYMARIPRGDYSRTNDWIKYTSGQKLLDVSNGRPEALRAANLAISKVIAVMREQTRIDYFRCKRAESEEQVQAIEIRAERRALHVAKTIFKHGSTGFEAFEVATGGKPWREFQPRPSGHTFTRKFTHDVGSVAAWRDLIGDQTVLEVAA
jgi:hypothetical protein